MGNTPSPLKNPQKEYLAHLTFAPDELRHLQDRYRHLKGSHPGIDLHTFLGHLQMPPMLLPLGKRLFKGFESTTNFDHESRAILSEEQFLLGVERCCKGSLSQQFRFLFSLYQDETNSNVHDEERKDQLKMLLLDCVLLARMYYGHDEENDQAKAEADQEEKEQEKENGEEEVEYQNLHLWEAHAVNPMYESLLYCAKRSGEENDRATPDLFTTWASENVPHLFKSTIETLIRRSFLSSKRNATQHSVHAQAKGTQQHADQTKLAQVPIHPVLEAPPWHFPELEHAAAIRLKVLDRARLWLFAITLSDEDRLQTWSILYSTLSHGRSFNRFCNGVLGYQGPTILLIRTKTGAVLGAYSTSVWQDSVTFYGNSKTAIFSLDPSTFVYRATGKVNNFVFSNTKKTFSELPIGIGFGGDIGNFRLWIDGDFAVGRAKMVDTTYQKGPLVDGYDFEIEDLVVFGLGGEAAEKAQHHEKSREAQHLEKMRKVNRKMAGEGWNEGAGKWMMDMIGKTGHSEAFQDDYKEAKKSMKGETEE